MKKSFLNVMITVFAVFFCLSSYSIAQEAQFSTTEKALETESVATKATATALDYSMLVGTWVSSSSTANIPQVRIVSVGNTLFLKVYGNCVPTWCDWGWVTATGYGTSISSTSAIALTATYDQSFAERVVTAYRGKSSLALRIYTKFTDGSSRSNYYSYSTLVPE